MCTVTFVPTEEGFRLGMNRDERLVRQMALPPGFFPTSPAASLYPHQPDGGTWIAVNERGIALALLNRNVNGRKMRKLRSRGLVIPHLIGHTSLAHISRLVPQIDLAGILPFLLVGISPAEQFTADFRWNGTRLVSVTHPWERRHWYSSGISDERADAHRAGICSAAWERADAGSTPWLRALHRSHDPQPGAFSICVHRGDAASVSYTEIEVGPGEIVMHYSGGPPCGDQRFASAVLERKMPCPTGPASRER
jgi:hypothetical protein